MRYCVYTYIYTLIIEREREVANVGHRIRIEDTHMSHMRSQRVYVDVYSTHMLDLFKGRRACVCV